MAPSGAVRVSGDGMVDEPSRVQQIFVWAEVGQPKVVLECAPLPAKIERDVIPAKAGIHFASSLATRIQTDSCPRGTDSKTGEQPEPFRRQDVMFGAGLRLTKIRRPRIIPLLRARSSAG